MMKMMRMKEDASSSDHEEEEEEEEEEAEVKDDRIPLMDGDVEVVAGECMKRHRVSLLEDYDASTEDEEGEEGEELAYEMPLEGNQRGRNQEKHSE